MELKLTDEIPLILKSKGNHIGVADLIAPHGLAPQVNAKKEFIEYIFAEGEYLIRKSISAIHRSFPEDYSDQFSEQDIINFLMVMTIICAIVFAYFLHLRDKKSSGTKNDS